MSGTLFEAAEAWSDDPIHPSLDDPTPWEIVLRLTRPQREERVRHLIKQAHQIHADALELAEGKEITGHVLLFSGGNDSTVLGHLFKDVATHAAHANTGIGIEATRQFVRDTCADWGLPLLEKHPPTSYRDLVLERGFPGPAMHYKMYQRLKERCLDQVRRDLIVNGRKQRVVFIAGRRRSESARRKDIPLHERDRSVIWASPIAMWTKFDMTTYRLMMGDVPVNVVSGHVGMSGECLCGAFAKPGELEMVGEHYPEVRAQIEALQVEVRAAGHVEPFCTWGHGQGNPSYKSGPMCTSCNLDTDPLWEIVERAAWLTDRRAEALDLQLPKLRAQYVATLRLYADEPWRLRDRADRIEAS
jgi:3'-phosphoadenosine 5'-phosphosulfate sulfotransferase (PAPS reductase)/FAD synthetase